MNNTKTLLLLTLALLLLNSAAAGETTAAKPAGSLPGIDQVLDKYVQAIGGKSALQKCSSRTVKGTIEVPAAGISADWQLFAKAPDKRVSIFEVQNFGTIRDGYDGRVSWTQNPATGLTEKSGEELARAKREADFYRDLNLKVVYPNLKCKSLEKVGDEEAYLAEAKPSSVALERFYFSTKTGLVIRHDYEADSAEGHISATVGLSDYREVDGVKLPFLFKIKASAPNQPEMEFTLKFKEVKHNEPIDDAKFEKPKN